jgi:predicted nucleic acid-binding protein
LADALHLAQAQEREAFMSFDQRFAAVANALGEDEGTRAMIWQHFRH